MNKLVVFAFALLSTSSWASVRLGSDPTLDARGFQAVDLDESLDAVLQAYFQKIIRAVGLPGENLPTRVQLFTSPSNQEAAFMTRRRRDVVFWSVRKLVEGHAADVDMMTMGHEISHFFQKYAGDREAEYEADLQALVSRLFRIGQRDERGRPEAARVHVKTLVDHLQTLRTPDDYLDPGALVSGLKVAYAEQRMKRAFPEHPTARTELAPVIEALRDFVPELPVVPFARGNEKVDLYDLIGRGQWRDALLHFDAQRRLLMQSRHSDPQGRLGAQFTELVSQLVKLVPTTSDQDSRAELFDQLATLPNEIFTEWRMFLPPKSGKAREVFGDLWEAHRGQRWDLYRRFELDSKDVESSLGDELSQHAIATEPVYVAFAVSRLLRHGSESLPSLTLDDHPLLTFFYASMIEVAKTWLGPSTESKVVKDLTVELGRYPRSPDFGARLAARFIHLLSESKSIYLRRNLALLISKLDLDRDFPGFRDALAESLPREGQYSILRFYLQRDVSAAEYLKGITESGSDEVPRLIFDFVQNRTPTETSYEQILFNWLDHRVSEGQLDYVPSLGAAVWATTAGLRDLKISDQSDLNNFELSMNFDSDLKRWSKLLTAFASKDPTGLLSKISSESAVYLHPFLTLIDWDQAFKDFGPLEISKFMTEHRPLVDDENVNRTRLIRALSNTLASSLEDGGRAEPSLVEAAIAFLNVSASTTPEGQRLLETLLTVLQKDQSPEGTLRLHEALKTIQTFNFSNPMNFARLFAETTQRVHSPDRKFPEVGEDVVRQIMNMVHATYDPRIATAIGEHLMRAYRATPDQFHLFQKVKKVEEKKSTLGISLFWQQLFRNLGLDEARQVVAALRAGDSFSTSLTVEVQAALTEQSIYVPFRSVEAELRTRFEITNVDSFDKLSAPILAESDHEPERSEVLVRLREIIAKANANGQSGAKLLDEYNQFALTRDKRNHRLTVDSETFSAGVAEFHLWYELFQRMNGKQIGGLLNLLSKGTPLEPSLRAMVSMRLAENKIRVSAKNVEPYLTSNFKSLSPLQRAGVFQLILGANRELMRLPEFRQSVFAHALAQLPTAETRAVFLDLWEAGLFALPEVLRSLILSIVLSESGDVGSPEHALVMFLAHSGPLEQKMGQALAMSKIPKSYRVALRQLWNAAQELTWEQAWELIEIQKGDIRRAGYRLSRILNSGSTKVYLEVENPKTGHRLVLSVFRDGVENAVETGYADLKKFASALKKRNPARYGFLSLLVEDAKRTMTKELDPLHKRRMTEVMAGAYRRAAVKLGHAVDGEGGLRIGQYRFATISPDYIVLPEGSKIEGEHLADGESFQKLAETDPELYEDLTAKILALEAEVLRSPIEPIDKDRMPGQYLYNRRTKTLYILDAGQALEVDPAIKSELKDFMTYAFTGDVKKLDQLIARVTGRDVSASSSGKELWATETGLRPLTYLSQIAEPFVNAAEGDPMRTAFFDLLHGVRANLRLLQWEDDTGVYVLRDLVREDLMLKWHPGRAMKFGAAAVAHRLSTAMHRKAEAAKTQIPYYGIHRMEEAYSSCENTILSLAE